MCGWFAEVRGVRGCVFLEDGAVWFILNTYSSLKLLLDDLRQECFASRSFVGNLPPFS